MIFTFHKVLPLTHTHTRSFLRMWPRKRYNERKRKNKVKEKNTPTQRTNECAKDRTETYDLIDVELYFSLHWSDHTNELYFYNNNCCNAVLEYGDIELMGFVIVGAVVMHLLSVFTYFYIFCTFCSFHTNHDHCNSHTINRTSNCSFYTLISLFSSPLPYCFFSLGKFFPMFIHYPHIVTLAYIFYIIRLIFNERT